MKKTCILNAIERKRGKVVNIEKLRKKINNFIQKDLSLDNVNKRKKVIMYVESKVFLKLSETDLSEICNNELHDITFRTICELEDNFEEVYCKDFSDVLWDIFESLICEEWDITDEIMSYSEEISYAIDYMQNYYAGEVGYDDDGYTNYSISSLKKAIDDLYRYFIEQKLKENKEE